ncbi:nitroreductase family protein [Sulfurimonas sp. HSL-3221]|uniref:nitroreductase family protein n=1 Tax=Sulfurimonadaceae TaxID=2771471 RepID=UPI001E28F07F|nr:nitroreductase family protein [Sulfurimonas sp. HSL-3221]UFS61510.1 nitroreductase family protein [Sulfurimonas sp. HSL-3221]
MRELYDATALTPLRVARSGGYIDWASQPSLFKRYPEFLYRIGFDAHEELAPLALSRCITFEGDVGGKPYLRLNTPSAGNLHPVELYVQVRGVKGVLSGTYHLDALKEEMVLIRECGAEGLEHFVGMETRFDGFIFVVSVVPFRSEWKYGHRAWRYCYMDAGHQIGALCAAMEAHGLETTLLGEADFSALNHMMGFGQQEFVCAAMAVGKAGEKPVKLPKTPLMQVAPTDYDESDGVVPGWIVQHHPVGTTLPPRMGGSADEALQRARRSARVFAGKTMPADAFERIMHTLTRTPEWLNAYAIVLRDDQTPAGVYRGGKRIKTGDFAESIAAMLVDQRFVSNAEIVMVLSTPEYSADLQMASAAFAHGLSLEAAARGVGYTAIGAFYDKKLQTFLETPEDILYVGVFGLER